MKVVVLTKIPSPYQVELFDGIAARNEVELQVAYLLARDADRAWSNQRRNHRAAFLDTDLGEIRESIRSADLVVFSWYRDARVIDLLTERARSGAPWCFWGERPGFTHKGMLGLIYRRWRLRSLWRDSRVPIWGIGHWANEGYRKEFGARRYFHVPYVSNLRPFFEIDRKPSQGVQTILFSGSLIPRKGIEHLCEAFMRLDRRPRARLVVLGTGPLESSLRHKCRDDTRIQFLGFRDWDGLAEVYKNADVLFAPSTYDGWGLIVAEAMAAGIPVVASSEMGSSREMIEDGITGWFVAPGDVEGILESLKNVLDLPPTRIDEMRDKCRAKARDYDLQAGVHRFLHAAAESVSGWQRADHLVAHAT